MFPRILIILVVLFLPAVADACSGLSDETTKYYTDTIRDYRHLHEKDPHAAVRLENQMRSSLVNSWFNEDIDTRTRWFLTREFPLEIKAMFVRAVAWRKETYNGGPEKLYRLSKEYDRQPNAEDNGYLALSAQLLRHAALAGHPKAAAELPDHPATTMDREDTKDMARHQRYARALTNDPVGQTILVGSYLNVAIFEEDLAKGYYWYLHVQHMNHSAYLRGTWQPRLACVTEQQRKKAKAWFASGHVPQLY